MNDVRRINSGKITTKNMTRVSVLSVIAFLLMYIKMPLAFIAPTFMSLDFSDLPILIGGFAMGPVYGIIISLIKNILHIAIQGTKTGGVGELSNFIVGASFVFAASSFYRNHKTYKDAVIALLIGVITLTVVASLSNYFIVFPLYGKVMSMEAIIKMGNAINSRIVDLKTMIIYAVVPFNLIKGFAVSALTMVIYKKISPILKG